MAANTEFVKIDLVPKDTWDALLSLSGDATNISALGEDAAALIILAENVDALASLAENADALLALLETPGDNTVA